MKTKTKLKVPEYVRTETAGMMVSEPFRIKISRSKTALDAIIDHQVPDSVVKAISGKTVWAVTTRNCGDRYPFVFPNEPVYGQGHSGWYIPPGTYTKVTRK